MRFEGIDAVGEAVDEHQFTTLWEPKGWERLPAEVTAATAITGVAVGSLDDLTVAELRAVAAGQGLALPARASKAEIIEALTTASASTEQKE